jgi:hypothetical protein
LHCFQAQVVHSEEIVLVIDIHVYLVDL